MSDQNQISLPNYIVRSLAGAWKLVLRNPKAMDHLDLSTDGFWKSFWALSVMFPAFVLWVFFNLQGGTVQTPNGIEISYPLLSEGIFFVIALPFTAIVMAYFTKYLKISENYASMVIAYNWVNAITYVILAVLTVILLSGVLGTQIAAILLMMLRFFFGFYIIWFTLKISLQISGLLAVGVLIFVKLLETAAQVMIFKIFNPEYFDAIFNAINNPPA